MYRNGPNSGVIQEDVTMTRSDYQLWSPSELTTNDVGDMQYFSADGVLFENALEYNDSVLRSIDSECKEPFNADDIIDSCMNQNRESTDTPNGGSVSQEGSDDGQNIRDYQLKIELPSDPASVLRSLSTMLDSAGGVDSKDKVFVKIMESSILMPVQCILINVLRATSKVTLKRLLSEGVWAILHGWLLEARTQNNKPLMLEILQLCKLMPVNTKLLKTNSFAKDIKQLIKYADERISRLAKVIVDDWVSLVTGVKSSNSKSTGQQRSRKPEAPRMVPVQPEHPAVEETPVESDTKSPIDGDNATEARERPRPKTVKALPIKFRSTGLEYVETENSPKPPVKPVERSVSQKSINGSSSIASFLNKPLTPNQQSPKSSKIKLIPARPLQPELSEKSAFLDALKSSSSGPIRRKRKVPSSPSKVAPSAPLDSNKDEIAAALKSAAQCLNVPEKEGSSSDAVGSNVEEVPVKRSKTKKNVTWASDNDLCDYFYFEVDPDERVNVNKTVQSSSDFNDHRRHEIEMERRALVGMCHSGKKGISLVEWRCPPAIDGPDKSVVPGCESKEKFIQAERETKVLQVIYFSQDSVPDSPGEPEEETMAAGHSQCRIIPLDDEEEPMDVESNPEPTSTSKSPATLPPILTNLFGNLMNQSPNVDNVTSTSSPMGDIEPNIHLSPYPPDERFEYNQPPNHQMPMDPGNFQQPPPRNDFNFPMQQFNNHRDNRYNYPEEPPQNHFRPRNPGPPFHQNEFRGRGSGPRHGGFGGQICQFFMAGNCRFGTNCRNLHPR